jgi:large subunit ribosomal protein L31
LRSVLIKRFNTMKKDIHPANYRFVVFKDFSCDYAFLGRSTAETKDKVVWEDGKEYPLVKLEISSASHPFFTGKSKFVDTAGRIEKFQKKYGNFTKK